MLDKGRKPLEVCTILFLQQNECRTNQQWPSGGFALSCQWRALQSCGWQQRLASKITITYQRTGLTTGTWLSQRTAQVHAERLEIVPPISIHTHNNNT